MPNPLDDIENAKAQRDLGVTIFRVYAGAREEGASVFEAFLVAVAWVRGLIGANDDKPPEEETEA